MEKNEKEFTHGRQIGSYPLLLTSPYKIEINKFTDVMVVDYGFRSLSVIPLPITINSYSKKILCYLPNFGKKRAEKVAQNIPYKNMEEFKEKLDDTSIIKVYEEFIKFD